VNSKDSADISEGRNRPRLIDGRKCLFIASEVRCGSTFIAETIAYELNKSCGFAFWALAKERFSFVDENSTADEVMDVWRAMHIDTSGFSTSKLMCKALSHIHRLANERDDVREAFFGENAYWIVVRRRDRIEQAISLALAAKTNTFHHYDDPQLAKDKDAELTLAEMDWALKAISMSDIYLQAFESSLPPERTLSVFYNDFLADEAGYVEKVHEMCALPVFDRANYVNESKLRPTARDVKKHYVEQLRQWFLAHFG
jgi:LPS sulfotransferase NodH